MVPTFPACASILPMRYAESHRRAARTAAIFPCFQPSCVWHRACVTASRRRLGVDDSKPDDGGWWTEMDHDVLACLRDGPKSPSEMGKRLGLSAAAMNSLLLMLAAEGRVRVDRVKLA
jgi:hypothetical protein